MKIPRILLIALLAAGLSAVAPAMPAQADGVVSGYDLEHHDIALDYGKRASFYDCWQTGAHPVLSVWTGSRWVEWDHGSVSKDSRKCRYGTSKVTYTFNVNRLGRFDPASGFYLVKVKEACSNCNTEKWTLPVFAVTPSRPYPTFVAPTDILLFNEGYSMCPVDFAGNPRDMRFEVNTYDGRDYEIVGLQDDAGRQYAFVSSEGPANEYGNTTAVFAWSGPFPESSNVTTMLVRPTRGGVDGVREVVPVPIPDAELWGTSYC